jgi:replicative DNA helicase
MDNKTNELPHDLLAEKALIASLIIDNRSFDEISDFGLTANDFYHPQYGMIFSAILDLAIANVPYDIVSLCSKLNDLGKLEKVNGQAGIVAIAEDQLSSASIVHYAKIVKEKSVLREIIRAAGRVIDSSSGSISDLQEYLTDVESTFFQLTNQTKTNNLKSFKESLREVLQDLQNGNRQKGEILGLSTGFKSIDKVLLGMQEGQLIILAARPGVGKTSLALNFAINSCKHSGKPIAIYSYEMLSKELSARIISSEACVDSRKIKTNDYTDMDLRNLLQATQKISNLPIYINDSGATTLLDIRSQCRKIKAEQGLGVIVIDYLQLMKPHIRKPQREQEIAEISRGLKELAKELRCPIIALSQLNRSSMARADKRPALQDLRESGSIEQDADVVMLIHREDAIDTNAVEKGIAELIVAKNRAGECQNIKMSWIGSQTKFAEISYSASGDE